MACPLLPARWTPQQARRLLAQLDVPDCSCPHEPIPCGHDTPCDCPVLLPPPCRHILERVHSLTCLQWGALCLLAFPGEYAEPRGRPTLPGRCLLRAQRVAIYRARAALGLALWHEGDRWRRQPTDDGDLEGPRAERLHNGYLDPRQRLAAQGAT